MQFKIGDMVRVKETAPRHGGKVGYIDLLGEGPAKDTVILCTEKRMDGPEFRLHRAILFAAYITDIERLRGD
jgi:hypothetical protein